MNNTIHDKTDEFHWSSNIEIWGDEINDGDVVIGIDPQERLGDNTFSVVEISKGSPEEIIQRGLFWSKTEAMIYADTLVGNELK